ncbi:MAG: Adenosylcobinamide amidohydrolase [Syntrophorhabdaceae bacterium PtaU1.Bin034]|nr:MAG: Adenosylcobinamide amidohydrolase [Syntrophorhabdaceae bacterium PtaU1.Bin034]
MKVNRIMIVALLLLMPSLTGATEIMLSPELKARAAVIRSDREGLWEKTLVVRFLERRRVLSTNDGMTDAMAVANHAAHPHLWSRIDETMKTDHEVGGIRYMRMIRERTARQAGLRSEDISLMGTAADMDNMAVVTKTFGPFVVTALVTAGARGNAVRTGVDEGTYTEPEPFAETPVPAKEPEPGTINIMLLCNARITDGGLARAIITATEAKTAALEDLKVPSTYTKNVQATGTGTDSMIVVSGTSGPLVTYPGGHSRIGELMGKAVYEAVVEALGKQNGFKLPGIALQVVGERLGGR